MNKASGGDGIPVELFQILKDDAVKMLHSTCQQIWKAQQYPQTGKGQFSHQVAEVLEFQLQHQSLEKGRANHFSILALRTP